METWKAIPGYEGLYEINLDRKIRSLNYLGCKGRIKELKQAEINGYFKIYLYKNKRKKLFGIHQLMAITFLGHVPNGHEFVVDHIDNNNRTNNSLENLQIITHRKNTSKDRKRNLPTGVYFHFNKSKSYQAKIQIKGKNIHLGYYKTPEEASEAYQNHLKKLC